MRGRRSEDQFVGELAKVREVFQLEIFIAVWPGSLTREAI